MIELRTLGVIELTRTDGAVAASLASRNKLLGVLTYLALRGEGTARRREELCALFWPESDEQRGRNALNQILHAIRSNLGSDLVIGGRETVGLDSDLIRCDATEFNKAHSRDDWQAALDLYGGEFLPGYHLTAAPEFERWVDEQRAIFSRRAFEAARHLARSKEASGDDRGSLSALRRARGIRPEDDDTVREVIAGSLRLGNAGAAIREFESYRSFLRNEFGLEPPEETAALYSRLVARSARAMTEEQAAGSGASGISVPGPQLDLTDVEGSTVGAGSPDSRESLSNVRGRRVARLAPLGLVLAGSLVVVSLFMGTSARPGYPTLDEYRIAVLPVRISSEEDLQAARTLARGLDGWADLGQVEPSRLDAAVAAAGGSVLGPDQGEEIARRVGAGRFILVRAEPRGSKPAVRAELYSTTRSDDLIALVDTAGASGKSGDEWYVDVLLPLFRGQSLGVAPGLREADWIAEPRAMFPYYAALAYEHRGELDSALAYLAQAVAIDSTFGTAWDLMAALAATAEPIATVDWERRNRYRAMRDTALARAAVYYSEPEFSPAGLAHAKRLAELFPDSVQLQWQVGIMYRDLALEQGFDPDSALPYFERAVELDSLQDVSRLITWHTVRGRLREAQRLVDHSLRNGLAIFRSDYYETFLDIVLAETDRQRDSVLVASWQKDDPPGAYAVWRTIVIQDSMSIPRRVTEVVIPMAGTDGADGIPIHMTLVELSAGRASLFDSLAKDAVWPSQNRFRTTRAYGNVPGVLEEPKEVIVALRDSLDAASNEHWILELEKRWLLGLLSVRLGDFDGAEQYARAFEQLAADSIPMGADSFFVRLAREFPLEIRAAAKAVSGRPQEALDLIEEVRPLNQLPSLEDPLGLPGSYRYLNLKRPFARLLRADLLFALGRYEEAAGWYATFPSFLDPWEDVGFLAPAHRGRARSLDALGRHEEALHYYRRFVTRWQDANPHLQPQVDEARQRIAELEIELAGHGSEAG